MTAPTKPPQDDAVPREPMPDERFGGGGKSCSQTMAPPPDAGPVWSAVHSNQVVRPRIKRIALVATNRLSRDALCYALNACRRMDARLDILTNLPPEEADRAVIAARGASDTPWRVVSIGHETRDDILRYVRNESGLLLLASASDDQTARRIWDTPGPNRLQLGVPWVEVEGKQEQR